MLFRLSKTLLINRHFSRESEKVRLLFAATGRGKEPIVAQNTTPAFVRLTSLINWSEDARLARAQALGHLDLPHDSGYVRGVVPREYLRIMAEDEAAPEGSAQIALHLYDLARAAGLNVRIGVEEYNSPCDYDIEVLNVEGEYLETLMVQSCGYGCSYILHGTHGQPMEGSLAQWANYFRQRAAAC